jgi:EAL domain-containing protein (putative c-di-GMP-specific phosphodiesterase class I)
MTLQNISHLDRLRLEFKIALELDLDKFGLSEEKNGIFSGTFIGVKLDSAFQPIYHVHNGDIIGHEAILKPNLGYQTIDNVEFAFTYAEKSGKLIQFDRVTRTLHALNYKKLYQENGLFFLSVQPGLLQQVSEHGKIFERILHRYSIDTERVVIQIEEPLIESDSLLNLAIKNYKERGYKIALTHFATAHSRIQRLWELAPDFVKFAPEFIQQSAQDERLQKVPLRLQQLITDLGAQAIITGVSTQAELDLGIQAGFAIFQGDFLGEAKNADELLKRVAKNTQRKSA